MSVNAPAASSYCCLVVQKMLDDILGVNAPSKISLETNGFLNAVSSEENTRGFQAVQTRSRQGKSLPDTGNRKCEIEYRKKGCAPVSDVAPSLCDPAAAIVDDKLYATVSVDCVKSTSFAMDKELFRNLCENPNERQAREIADRVDALKKAVNDDLIAKFIAGLGNYPAEIGAPLVDSAAFPITLNLFDAAARPNAMGFYPLLKHFRRSGWSGTPIVVGGNTLEAWQEARRVFAGNVDGFDANRAGSVSQYVDYAVDPTFADALEHLLVFHPGAVQMLEWFQYEKGSIYEELKEDYQETVLNFGGFEVDFTVNYDKCTKQWVLSFTKHYDLFKMPDDALSADCGQFSNGCLQYLIDCGDLDCNYIKC